MEEKAIKYLDNKVENLKQYQLDLEFAISVTGTSDVGTLMGKLEDCINELNILGYLKDR